MRLVTQYKRTIYFFVCGVFFNVRFKRLYETVEITKIDFIIRISVHPKVTNTDYSTDVTEKTNAFKDLMPLMYCIENFDLWNTE